MDRILNAATLAHEQEFKSRCHKIPAQNANTNLRYKSRSIIKYKYRSKMKIQFYNKVQRQT